jgi:hypothetical protein
VIDFDWKNDPSVVVHGDEPIAVFGHKGGGGAPSEVCIKQLTHEGNVEIIFVAFENAASLCDALAKAVL